PYRSRRRSSSTSNPKNIRSPNFMKRPLAALFLSLSSLLSAGEIRLAVLGNIPESKSVETLAVHFAVDAVNAKGSSLPDKLKLVGFHTKGTVEGAIDAAKK